MRLGFDRKFRKYTFELTEVEMNVLLYVLVRAFRNIDDWGEWGIGGGISFINNVKAKYNSLLR